jgi:hypothetical protein
MEEDEIHVLKFRSMRHKHKAEFGTKNFGVLWRHGMSVVMITNRDELEFPLDIASMREDPNRCYTMYHSSKHAVTKHPPTKLDDVHMQDCFVECERI